MSDLPSCSRFGRLGTTMLKQVPADGSKITTKNQIRGKAITGKDECGICDEITGWLKGMKWIMLDGNTQFEPEMASSVLPIRVSIATAALRENCRVMRLATMALRLIQWCPRSFPRP
jgi:hypothetical protein